MSSIKPTILSTKDLCIGYKHRKLLDKLNVDLYKGEVICLIGKNGCGKSTLIRTLCGLQDALSGTITINGKAIQKLSYHEKAQLISVVLTDKVHTDSLTVSQIVALGRHPYTNWLGNLTEKDEGIVGQSIASVHLEHKKDDLYTKLSDGEKQRVMIAKALTQDTPIIFLDEPSAHLDVPNRMEIMILLQQLAKNTEKTILLSTHELDLALQTADKLWLMNDQNIHIGIPEDLVLSNIVEENFSSSFYYFNRYTGNFNMHYASDKSICIKGDAYLVYWTTRALNRIGYTVDENAPITISITEPNTWVVETANSKNTLSSVESVLYFLQYVNI
ncbi:MAG: ABC transporter ATP-binding protein [Paludibacteraceae bacterium]|nr:ABC transporter ATP-binding protein [Paludibacteraceae bacterium]